MDGAMIEKKLSEADLMRSIMLALSEDGHMVFRGNVGLFFTKDGRPVKSGLPVGFSDLFGFTNRGARPFFLEVKTDIGRVSPAQQAFIASMRQRGAIAEVVRSVKEAVELLRNSQ
jgi:hypothetical protein